MNETSALLLPYDFHLDGDMRYTFTTVDGIVYHAYFIDYGAFFPNFPSVYMFNIEPETEVPHPIDIRISHTIVKILSLFFENDLNTMIMVCDNTDGREYKRNLLFERWYQRYGASQIAKYDASVEDEDYMLYVSLFVHAHNPLRKDIVSYFYDLVRNNMYPI